MKLVALLIPALMVSSMALAQEGGAAPAGDAPKKMTAKEAKKECKAEGKKGKELKKCVKEKLHK